MKTFITPIVIGANRTIPKRINKETNDLEMRGRVKTIQKKQKKH